MKQEYQSPQSKLDKIVNEYSNPFFVTSIRKMVVLYLSTLGIYSIYWCYKQWKIIRFHEKTNISPALRSVFLIFFIFSIFKKISQFLAREKSLEWDFRPSAYLFLLLYVVTMFGDKVTSIFASAFVGDVVVFLSSMLSVIPLVTVQRQANIACDDSAGEANSSFSVSNIIFVVIGVLFWLLIMMGIVVSFLDVPAN